MHGEMKGAHVELIIEWKLNVPDQKERGNGKKERSWKQRSESATWISSDGLVGMEIAQVNYR